MTFDEALRKMRDHGFNIAREGWNGKGMYLGIFSGAGQFLPWIQMKTAQGNYVPWTASQTDILADDWVTL